MEKVEKLTQEQYNRLKFEGEVKKDILKRTLKYYYSNINVVNEVTDFCNSLWTMEHLELREIENFEIKVVCYASINGYDEETKKYIII